MPIRTLAGFQRIALAAGERRTVTFTVAPRYLSVIDDAGRRVIEPGAFTVSVGGKQPGFRGSADAFTTGVLTRTLTVAGAATPLPR